MNKRAPFFGYAAAIGSLGLKHTLDLAGRIDIMSIALSAVDHVHVTVHLANPCPRALRAGQLLKRGVPIGEAVPFVPSLQHYKHFVTSRTTIAIQESKTAFFDYAGVERQDEHDYQRIADHGTALRGQRIQHILAIAWIRNHNPICEVVLPE